MGSREPSSPLPKRTVPELHQWDFGIARTLNGNFAIVPIASGIIRVAVVEWDQPQVDHDAPMTFESAGEKIPH